MRTLKQAFRGELDWIVRKAIKKDRDRRYETANAFASDIQRFLDDEPVQACPRSWSYRFGKALRRNRIAAVFAGGVLVSMSLGLSIAFWQLQRALVAESKTTFALTRVDEQKFVSERRLAIAEQAVDDMYVQVASKWLSQQTGRTQVQREFLEKAIATYEIFVRSTQIN